MKEIEKRVFLTDEQFNRLHEEFNFSSQKPEKQITTYFDVSNEDIRLMQTTNYFKLWMKGGLIHDDARDEVEGFISLENKLPIFAIFEKGFKVDFKIKAKWYRERYKAEYKKAEICLDSTIHYGKIFEIEIRVNDKSGEEEAKKLLDTYLTELNLVEADKMMANEKYTEYLKKWKSFCFPEDISWLKS